MYKLLAINPGSTSTKIGVFEDEKLVLEETIRHDSEDLKHFTTISDQFAFRKDLIIQILQRDQIELNSFSAIVGRGGLIKPLKSGTYEVNDNMIFDLKLGLQGQHASNLGGIIAKSIADEQQIKAYIVDPVVVDEMDDIAKITGVPELPRNSMFHALNQKAIARKAAKEMGKKYEECNFVVAHLGGGISVGAHRQGRVVDVNNPLLGDGPFSPDRSGTVPSGKLINLCYQGFGKKDIEKKFSGNSGLCAYLGTTSGIEVKKMIENGDEHARMIYDAMAYGVAKEIGGACTVLEGKFDGILLTGGLAFDELFISMIVKRIGFLGSIKIMPGEEELTALAEGTLRVLRGEEEAKTYQ